APSPARRWRRALNRTTPSGRGASPTCAPNSTPGSRPVPMESPANRTRVLPHDDDTTLILAARAGDRAAFSRLYTRFAPMVHAVLLARVNPADADDLVQEVFLVAMRKLHT